MSDVESVERVIAAPPEKIFDLLADPARHHDIDGSGSVVIARWSSVLDRGGYPVPIPDAHRVPPADSSASSTR